MSRPATRTISRNDRVLTLLRHGRTIQFVADATGLPRRRVITIAAAAGLPLDQGSDTVHPGPVTEFPAAASELLATPASQPQPWRDQALCAQTDPEVFYPEPGASPDPAKQICRRCPVQQQCLDTALATNEQHGIWGGTSPQERRKLTRTKPCQRCRHPMTAGGRSVYCGTRCRTTARRHQQAASKKAS